MELQLSHLQFTTPFLSLAFLLTGYAMLWLEELRNTSDFLATKKQFELQTVLKKKHISAG